MNGGISAKAEQNQDSGTVVLALDTSTAAMAASVMRGSEVLAEVQSLAERNHSVHVITHVKELLQKAGISRDGLDAIVVGSGPGSYTGMRIAVTAAKTLGWAWHKQVVGVSSLEAVALGGWSSGMASGAKEFEDVAERVLHIVVPIMDARRGGVYTACFDSDNKGADWRRGEPDGVRLMADWAEHIANAAAEQAKERPVVVWLTGDLSLHGEGAAKLAGLGAASGVEVRLAPYVLDGRFVGQLGLERLRRGETDDVHSLIPNYTQLTEAEVKLKQRLQMEEIGAEQKHVGAGGQ